jgi:hypothetical protein
MVKRVKSRVVHIDPQAPMGHPDCRSMLAALAAGDKVAVLRSANREECLAAIYAVALQSTVQTPYYLVCDEAPLYLDRATDALKKILYQGRHRGLGMMILSQRPTAIAAAIRSQASVTFWGRLSDHLDTSIAAQAIGPVRARALSTARPGVFVRHPPERN